MQNKQSIDDAVEFIQNHNIDKVYIIGNEENFTESIEEDISADVVRIQGSDRYETNKKIINEFCDTEDLNKIYVIRDGIVNYKRRYTYII